MGQWIIGYPTETVEIAYESLLLHCRLGDIPQVHIASPLPGTEMYDLAHAKGMIHDGQQAHNGLYSDFLFHHGDEKKMMRVIFNMFPLSRMPAPVHMEDMDFVLRSGRFRFDDKTTLGDVFGWGWCQAEGK